MSAHRCMAFDAVFYLVTSFLAFELMLADLEADVRAQVRTDFMMLNNATVCMQGVKAVADYEADVRAQVGPMK